MKINIHFSYDFSRRRLRIESKGIQNAIQSRDPAKSPTTHSHGAKGVDCLLVHSNCIMNENHYRNTVKETTLHKSLLMKGQ